MHFISLLGLFKFNFILVSYFALNIDALSSSLKKKTLIQYKIKRACQSVINSIPIQVTSPNLLYSMLNNVFCAILVQKKIPQHHVNLKRVKRVVYHMWILLNFSNCNGMFGFLGFEIICRVAKSSRLAIRTLFCDACHWQAVIIKKWLILNHIQHIFRYAVFTIKLDIICNVCRLCMYIGNFSKYIKNHM